MGLETHRLAHAAGRHIGWTLFMALLTSPFGGYLYVGRVRRAFGFAAILLATTFLAPLAFERFGWPDALSDLAVAAVLLGAMGDLVRIIKRSRAELHARGLSVLPANS